MATTSKLLSAALWYAEKLHWKVFPCVPNAKTPLTPHGFHEATDDPAQIRAWWNQWPTANIGVACGLSGIVAIDIDIESDGLPVPLEDQQTVTNLTPSGGCHLIYIAPNNRQITNETGQLPHAIHVRGHGGYIIVPPSAINGKTYTWEFGYGPHERRPASLPDSLLALLLQHSTNQTAAPPVEDTIPDGQRNSTLTSLAGTMRRRGMTEPEILAALAAVNEQRCNPPLPQTEIEKIAASVARYPPAENLAGNTVKQTNTDENGRIAIRVREDDLLILLDESWSAITKYNGREKRIFQRGGVAVTIRRDESGEPNIHVLQADDMREIMAQAARWYKNIVVKTTEKQMDTNGKEQPIEQRRVYPQDVKPPIDLARVMLATPRELLPGLLRIIRAPIITPSGQIVMPGYDPETMVYYVPNNLAIPDVSERPNDADIYAARSLLLDDLLCDFPFVEQADRANALAMLILPFVREMIRDHPTPLHLIEKPAPGSGAGLLSEALGLIATGTAPAFMVEGRDEDEWRKRITATLLAGSEVVVIDNLRGRLDSASLSAVLTARRWTDRLLGVSKNIVLPVRCVWIATGNNPAVSSEIARRCIPVRIDPKCEKPWTRSPDEFRHSRLLEWVRHNRARLIHAILTLIRAWDAAGRPTGTQTLGSYEVWSDVLGGVLQVAGITGFLENRDRFYERADHETTAWRDFITAWWDRFGADQVGTAELWSLLEPADGSPGIDPPGELGNSTERAQRIRLGRLISAAVDRRFIIVGKTLKIGTAGTYKRAAQYRLVEIT